MKKRELKWGILCFGLSLIVIGTCGNDALTITGCTIIIGIIYMDK